MITNARIRDDLADLPGVGWITCLRAPAIQELRDQGAIQLTIFDQQDMAEITSDEYPGERLVVRRNPLLAEERTRKRTDLLDATDGELSEISARVMREEAAARRGGDWPRCRTRPGSSPRWASTTTSPSRTQRSPGRATRSELSGKPRLDGFYVIRAKVPQPEMSAADLVATYKGLSAVERAFRTLKGVDPEDQADLPPAGEAGPGTRPALHARLLCRVPHAQLARASALPGRPA